MRAAIYARYSSDNQRDASIEDQVRQCTKWIDGEGWSITEAYADRAISGATTLRAGYQQLLMDARAGKFDIAIAESLDRFSQDQEDIAGLYKQLTFAGVKLITLADGEINELHIGLKGTMNALFLKDLAQKTKRGLEGRVRKGFSGGGNAFGYDVIHELAADGTPVRGKRKINIQEAGIVERIFKDFAAGNSPKTIAHRLNNEGIPGPKSNEWGPSTIYGNWRRGTGILNNELYIGRLVWNRQHFIKNPVTGKRQARLNPEEDWIIEEVPALRIVSDDLWAKVKTRQEKTRSRVVQEPGKLRSELARRPRYLLSGLLKCGVCGGGYSMSGANRYGCSTAINKGTCSNKLTIRRDEVESKVLGGLRHQLMHPELVKAFVEEFHREFNRLAANRDIDQDRRALDLAKVEREIKLIITAIKDGVSALTLKDELASLENRKIELGIDIEQAPAPMPRLHPNLSELYRQKIDRLHETLNQEDVQSEASEVIRSLIDEIRLMPDDGSLKIELYGDLAGMLALANNSPTSENEGLQVTMVAGVGFEPTTFRL
jgi:site-specific DNA recombinase